MTTALDTPGWRSTRKRWPGDPGAPGGRANRVGFDYEAYVPGPIADWHPSIPADFAADLGRVQASLATLRTDARRLSALLWPLLRSEAIASSRIEGLAVNHEHLARALYAGEEDARAAAVLGNLDALRRALDLADEPVTTQTFLELHRVLLAATDAGIAGRVRAEQNWIGGRHPNPRGAAFVPPPPEEVGPLLEDLARFCERDDLPPLLQAAIAHVQFETIHPFADGNGRVGRALIQLVLRRHGLTGGDSGPPVFPPVSLVLAARADEYVAGLTAFRAGDHQAWWSFFLDVVHASVALAEDLAAWVTELVEQWHAQAGNPRRDSAAAALIARLPERPIVGLADVVELTGVSRQAARLAIDRLTDAGVLREITGRRRGRRWEAVGLFALLDQIEVTGSAPRSR